MSDEDRWRESEPGHEPSAPSTLRFDPFATALGVFCAVGIPIVTVGFTLGGGRNSTVIVVGLLAGVIAGLLAGVWISHRDGRVWRGRQF